MTPDADARAAGLYEFPLAEFTAARNALAAGLKAEGDPEGAAAVRALRKPSRAAWAVNQLVRAEPELVVALLGAGGELRQAHRRAASGHGAEQLRAAADAERAAVEGLMARAGVALGGAPGPALAEAMRNTFHAASSDDEARQLVSEGRVTEAMRPIGLGPVPTGRAAAPAPQPDQKRKEHARALKAAQAEEAALRREAGAAQRSLERAEAALVRARDAAEAASERAKDARRRARTARIALTEAERRVARIERETSVS
jgi:hypothetical protein